MKRFQFGLDTVLQYKRQVLDGAQNEYAEAIQRVRQQERRLREAEARHRSLNQQFRRAEAEGITIADAMGYQKNKIRKTRSRRKLQGFPKTGTRFLSLRACLKKAFRKQFIAVNCD